MFIEKKKGKGLILLTVIGLRDSSKCYSPFPSYFLTLDSSLGLEACI